MSNVLSFTDAQKNRASNPEYDELDGCLYATACSLTRPLVGREWVQNALESMEPELAKKVLSHRHVIDHLYGTGEILVKYIKAIRFNMQRQFKSIFTIEDTDPDNPNFEFAVPATYVASGRKESEYTDLDVAIIAKSFVFDGVLEDLDTPSLGQVDSSRIVRVEVGEEYTYEVGAVDPALINCLMQEFQLDAIAANGGMRISKTDKGNYMFEYTIPITDTQVLAFSVQFPMSRYNVVFDKEPEYGDDV